MGGMVGSSPRPPAVGLSVAAGCNVRRLGVARKRSGVMCGRTGARVQQCPPEPGRGATATNNQAFCSAPCMANMRPTIIVLLRAWNSHEYATFFPDITYTSVRTMLMGRYVKKSCHW